MSRTLLRGLQLLETVDFNGPLSISELARLLDWDKATVSRVVAACEAHGWVERTDARISVGGRTSLLGRTNGIGLAQRDADLLVHAISGVTGAIVQAYALVGTECAVLASAGPKDSSGHDPTRALMSVRVPLWATAGGKMICAQLTPAQRQARLPTGELPDGRTLLATSARGASPAALAFYRTLMDDADDNDPTDTTAVGTRAELDAQLDQAGHDGVFVERREVGSRSCCVAVPWRRPGVIAALACLSTVQVVERDRALIERVLRAAASAGATRESIVAAAANGVETGGDDLP